MEAEWKALVVGALCLMTGLLGVGGLTINSRPYSTLLKPGSNATLECTVSGKGFNPFFNQIVWYKHIADDVIQISTGGIINSPFLETHRFAVNPEIFEKGEVVMPLSLTAVTVADDGIYVCQLMGQAGVMDSVDYTIRVPEVITNLTLFTNGTGIDVNGKLVTYVFKEQHPTWVFCRSVGGNPAPSLRMYIGKMDITSEFTRNVTATRVGEKGLEVVTYVVEMTRRDFRPEVAHSGKRLTCVAEMWQVHPLTKSVSVAIEVHYPPKFVCETALPAALYTVNYQLRCKITANPRADLGDIFWTVGGANGTKITAGESKDGFTAIATVDETDALTIDSHLTISAVNSSSYQQEFDLYASNDLGQRHHQIVICEVTETPNTTIITTTTQVTTTEGSPTSKTTQTLKPAWNDPEKQPVKPAPAQASADQIAINIATNIVIAIATMFMFGVIDMLTKILFSLLS